MPEPAKRNLWWALERLGLPTVLVCAFWYADHTQDKKLMDVAERREQRAEKRDDENRTVITHKLADIDIALRRVNDKIDVQSRDISDLRGVLQVTTAEISDHERRISRRELTAFAARDGAALQKQAAENAVINARQSEALSEIQATLKELHAVVKQLQQTIQAAQ